MEEETPPSIHTLCRTCLSNLKHDEAYDLFILPGLAKKLCVCTSLSVEQLDGYPRNLCTICYNRLNELHDFQKQCVDSVQKFKDIVSRNIFVVRTVPEFDATALNTAPQEEDHINFDPLLNTKLEIDNEEDVFKMIEDVDKESEPEEENAEEEEDAFNDSGSDFDRGDMDFQAAESSDTDDELPLSKLRSAKKPAKPKAKKSKEDKPAAKPKAKSKPLPSGISKRIFECHVCSVRFRKPEAYEDHMKHHSEQLPHQCPATDCQRGFTTTTGLKHHMEHTHPELCKLRLCGVVGCGESFTQTRMLTKHMRSVHNIEKPIIHPCTECEKVFRCPMALKKHMYNHTGEQLPFLCTICQKRFRVSSELRDHLLRHAGVKNFVCPYCGVGRTTKQELDKHILTHTKEKKFKCDQCDHTSHNKQCMAKHIKVVHMKIRNFVCQYCPKSFGSAYGCKNHEKLHTRDDCYECTICGRKFLFESRLTKHLRTHAKRKEKKAAGATKTEGEGEADKEQPKEFLAPTATPKPKKPPKPKDPRRVEVVDMSQLAGTSVNPIPSVSVSSWSPQDDFAKHEGEHICTYCGKHFNKIAGLKLHIKVVHDKIKDYACRFCPKRFSKTSHLRHHEYTHTGEKPYECKLCSARFRHDGTLRRHIEAHSKPPGRRGRGRKPKPKPIVTHEPRLKLNTEPVKIYEQFQDPEAERAAANAQLVAQQLDESEAKRRAEAKAKEIQEAACEQLQQMQQQKEQQQLLLQQQLQAEFDSLS